MSRQLDDLSVRVRPQVVELLARCVEGGIMVLIVETLRTWEEHQANLAKGVSWIAVSKHLDGATYRQAPRGSDAIDLCPYETYALHGPDKLRWDESDPIWLKLGTLGEGVGLRWGGRWAQKDLGHFEYVVPAVNV